MGAMGRALAPHPAPALQPGAGAAGRRPRWPRWPWRWRPGAGRRQRRLAQCDDAAEPRHERHGAGREPRRAQHDPARPVIRVREDAVTVVNSEAGQRRASALARLSLATNSTRSSLVTVIM